jgi:hypothetical protein
MARTPYKMKGSPMARNFGISPMKGVKPTRKGVKPTRKELVAAANDKSHPNHISNMESPAAYYAWRVGGKLKDETYHGAGGKVMNEDGTVNKVATKANKIEVKTVKPDQ